MANLAGGNIMFHLGQPQLGHWHWESKHSPGKWRGNGELSLEDLMTHKIKLKQKNRRRGVLVLVVLVVVVVVVVVVNGASSSVHR